MKEFMVVGAMVGAFIVAGTIGLAFALSSDDNTLSYTCLTKGAQIYDSSTKDGKYTTVWCVKNGVVVP